MILASGFIEDGALLKAALNWKYFPPPLYLEILLRINLNSLIPDLFSSFPSAKVCLYLPKTFQLRKSHCEIILMKMSDLNENETACKIHFDMKGFALRLVLKQPGEAQEISQIAYLTRHSATYVFF